MNILRKDMSHKTKSPWGNKMTVSNKPWGPKLIGSKQILSAPSFCYQRLTALRDSVVIESPDQVGTAYGATEDVNKIIY
tara:strand:- start:178 stop:414 length:237 start_codon:yes stop_codon:yes gene_type:complete